MDTKKKGRPPVAERRSRIHVTLPDDDIAVLKDFASMTGVSPATFIRQIVQTSIPDLKTLVEATRASQISGLDKVSGKGAALLAKHIKTAADTQEKLFNEK